MSLKCLQNGPHVRTSLCSAPGKPAPRVLTALLCTEVPNSSSLAPLRQGTVRSAGLHLPVRLSMQLLEFRRYCHIVHICFCLNSRFSPEGVRALRRRKDTMAATRASKIAHLGNYAATSLPKSHAEASTSLPSLHGQVRLQIRLRPGQVWSSPGPVRPRDYPFLPLV